jgi:hypothetical protein
MGRTWKSDYTRPEVEPWWESAPAAGVEDIEAEGVAAA